MLLLAIHDPSHHSNKPPSPPEHPHLLQQVNQRASLASFTGKHQATTTLQPSVRWSWTVQCLAPRIFLFNSQRSTGKYSGEDLVLARWPMASRNWSRPVKNKPGLASNILEYPIVSFLLQTLSFFWASEKSAGPVSFRGYWPAMASNFFCLSLTLILQWGQKNMSWGLPPPG